MSRTWQLQEAKNKFSNLVERTQSEGPQIVTKHGKEAVVVLSISNYKKMIKPETNLFEFMQQSPLNGIDTDISRDKKVSRDFAM